MNFTNIMTIEQLIASAENQKDFNAATLFKHILTVSTTYKISINDAITKLIECETKKYNLNLLMVARKFFPKTDNKYNKQEQQTICKLKVQPKSIRLYIK